MPRPVWSGTISFGLVNVPVKAFTAVRDHDVHFHQLDKKTGARIRYEKVSAKSGREVDADDIEMGFEITEGRHVTFDKKELEGLRPKSTKAIEVTDFVALADVDPIYYERTYWLAPDGDAAQANRCRHRAGGYLRARDLGAAERPARGIQALLLVWRFVADRRFRVRP